MLFFSSRRRHTRLQGDWSSDVCSNDLPVVAQRGIQRGQGVGDPAPFLDGGLRGVAAVDGVPHHGADDPESVHAAPDLCWTNTAAAPYTPAVPVSSPGTMRHASTAGLKARRFTSPRSGANSFSPARDRKSTRLNSSHLV